MWGRTQIRAAHAERGFRFGFRLGTAKWLHTCLGYETQSGGHAGGVLWRQMCKEGRHQSNLVHNCLITMVF